MSKRCAINVPAVSDLGPPARSIRYPGAGALDCRVAACQELRLARLERAKVDPGLLPSAVVDEVTAVGEKIRPATLVVGLIEREPYRVASGRGNTIELTSRVG